MNTALFQPIGSIDYNEVCYIDEREKVYRSLGLYSDYLNWNINPEIERELRKVLCKIYGHIPYHGPPFTWKPKGECYWCHVQCE